jgi:epoxyqueuosine reductase
MSLKERIRAGGRALGLAGIGFAAAGERPESRLFSEWLRRGYAGEMEYLLRRRRERSDPTVLAPWVKSLVVAVLPYPGSPPSPAGSPRVSRYARGRDYHRVFRDRLRALGRILEEAVPGARVRPVVDTGAVLEKPWAAAAGLGWQGKHTLLIHPEAGSWCFVGELLTDVEIEADRPPVADRCGTCTLCLDACPTAAFPEPYVLDSRRCISYLTIEHKTAIPEALRPLMADWVFGCDACQEVCPWNFRSGPGDPELEEAGDPPTAAHLIALGREEFNRRFAGTALRRTGRSRVLRNAVVALGNSGDPGAVPILRQALALLDPLVREHARWALDRLRRAAPAPAGKAGGDASPAARETTEGSPWE